MATTLTTGCGEEDLNEAVAPVVQAVGKPAPKAKAPAGRSAARASAGDLRPRAPLGVNTGIGLVHDMLLKQYDMNTWTTDADQDVERLSSLGARWYRAHNAAYPGFDQRTLEADTRAFAHHDHLVRSAQESGIDVLIVLGRTNGMASCGKYAEKLPSTMVPKGADEQRYTDYVTSVVERYDGDGVGDMAGLKRPVRWFQVGNEHDLHSADCERAGKSYATPEQVLELYRISHGAMKQANPDAGLVLSVAFGQKVERANNWVGRLYAADGGAILDYVDVVNLHDYGFDTGVQLERIRAMDSLANGSKPIWITETSVPGDPEVYRGWDQTRQARTAVELIMQALTQPRVERMFWHTLHDGPNMGRDPFSSNGLFQCERWTQGRGRAHECVGGWSPKPVARAFRLLSDALEGWESVSELPGRKGWRITRSDRGDAVVLLPGQGSYDASNILGAGSVKVWDLVEHPSATSYEPGSMPSRSIPLGDDPVLASAD